MWIPVFCTRILQMRIKLYPRRELYRGRSPPMLVPMEAQKDVDLLQPGEIVRNQWKVVERIGEVCKKCMVICVSYGKENHEQHT